MAVRLSVRAKAPRRRTCVSRTTLSPDSAGAEEDGKNFLRERLPVVLWQGPDLFGKGPDS